MKRPFAFAAIVSILGILAPASPVAAATAIQCQGGPSHFAGFEKKAAIGTAVTDVRIALDKQVVPLCLNPGLAASASSWWDMITQGPSSANDYIQYGFWTCQTWCNFGWPGGGTNGEVHEFLEYNNGNLIDGPHRVDLGNIANGHYQMEIRYVGGLSPRFEFWRGSLRATVNDNGWRDWSLSGAKFAVYSETWDLGDQNGGTSANKVEMDRAGWGLDFQPLTNTGMDACQKTPDNPNGWYNCTRYTFNVANDSVRTWTSDR